MVLKKKIITVEFHLTKLNLIFFIYFVGYELKNKMFRTEFYWQSKNETVLKTCKCFTFLTAHLLRGKWQREIKLYPRERTHSVTFCPTKSFRLIMNGIEKSAEKKIPVEKLIKIKYIYIGTVHIYVDRFEIK